MLIKRGLTVQPYCFICYFADNSGEWQVVQGNFVAINAVTMSCSCDLSPLGLSPSCHLGDGCLDLLLMSHCSRFTFLRALIRTAKGEHVSILIHFHCCLPKYCT